MADETPVRQRFEAVRGQLDERGLRLLAAAEARAAGYGAPPPGAGATGARSTIGRGLLDLDEPALPPGRVRRPGSGRKPVHEKDPTLLADLRCVRSRTAAATTGRKARPRRSTCTTSRTRPWARWRRTGSTILWTTAAG